MTTSEKILRNRPVPWRLLNSPVMCTSLKSYDVSFLCDLSKRNIYPVGNHFDFFIHCVVPYRLIQSGFKSVVKHSTADSPTKITKRRYVLVLHRKNVLVNQCFSLGTLQNYVCHVRWALQYLANGHSSSASLNKRNIHRLFTFPRNSQVANVIHSGVRTVAVLSSQL